MEVGYLREGIVKRIMVIEFGVNDGGGSGASCVGIKVRTDTTRMWANAQPDGRPVEHRWRPLFNAATFA